jgi:hypothetical protein
LPVYRAGGGAFVLNNLIYIIGGYTGTQASSPYGTIDRTPPILVYDPENDSWSTKEEVPISFANPIMVNGTVYFITRNLSVAYKYDIINDSWTPVFTQFPNDTTGGFIETSCFAAVGDKIYFLGGTSNTTQLLNTVIEGTIIPDNDPPTTYAGEDITIMSEIVGATVIPGTASDENPDDVLEYRWRKGEILLTNWTPVEENGECPLDLSTTSLEIGTHTLTLEVTDGEATSTDDMVLVITNSPPHPSPSGSGVYEINTAVALGGYVSDYDGDLLSYKWMEGINVLFSGAIQTINGGTQVELPNHSVSTFSLGIHTIILQVDDDDNEPVSVEITVEIVDTIPPTIAPASNKTLLWPPNHELKNIIIEANASDNSGLPVMLSATISSNEPINGLGDGDKFPDWTEPVIDQENGIISFQLRAERSGKGIGRLYIIDITATDALNNSTTENIEITVPHDKSKKVK